MRSAIDSVDVVRKREDLLVVAVVVLHRHLDREFVRSVLEIDRFLVQRRFVAVQVLYEFGDAALVIEFVFFLLFFALVADDDANSLIQECLFTQPLREFVKAVNRRFEDLGVRLEGHFRSALVRRAGFRKRRDRNADVEFHFVRFSVTPNFELQPLRKKIHARNTDAVQSARNLVGIRIELAARVQNGHHDLGRRTALLLVHPDGNSAAVINDGDRVIHMDRHLDRVAKPGKGLVNRVVNDLVNQVMQPQVTGRTDVHRGAFADRIAALKHSYRICCIFCLCLCQLINL